MKCNSFRWKPAPQRFITEFLLLNVRSIPQWAFQSDRFIMTFETTYNFQNQGGGVSSEKKYSTEACSQRMYLVSGNFLCHSACLVYQTMGHLAPLYPSTMAYHLLWWCAGAGTMESCIKSNFSFKLISFLFLSSICHTMKWLTDPKRTLIFSPQQILSRKWNNP